MKKPIRGLSGGKRWQEMGGGERRTVGSVEQDSMGPLQNGGPKINHDRAQLLARYPLVTPADESGQ
jgi:hypothetical protein